MYILVGVKLWNSYTVPRLALVKRMKRSYEGHFLLPYQHSCTVLLWCRDNVTNLMDMAQFLKQNGTEDFKVYSDTMCAIYRGVRLWNC